MLLHGVLHGVLGGVFLLIEHFKEGFNTLKHLKTTIFIQKSNPYYLLKVNKKYL